MNLRQGIYVWAGLSFLALEIAVAFGLALAGSLRSARNNEARAVNQRLVAELGLADLALWSDASYCRHPSLAVFFSAHADHPSAMEHFPAGSIVPPPRAESPSRPGEP